MKETWIALADTTCLVTCIATQLRSEGSSLQYLEELNKRIMVLQLENLRYKKTIEEEGIGYTCKGL